MTAWQCRCGWTGFSPSFSDASDLRPNVHGQLVMDRTHLPVCPRCYSEVQTVREVARRELSQVLVGIGRLA
jgi:hypothetical protein